MPQLPNPSVPIDSMFFVNLLFVVVFPSKNIPQEIYPVAVELQKRRERDFDFSIIWNSYQTQIFHAERKNLK